MILLIVRERHLQYKMFLLNPKVSSKPVVNKNNLQYKMFLLNEKDENGEYKAKKIYNTKCFY